MTRLAPLPGAQLTDDRAQLAYDGLILATRVGSEVHGINIPGTDDHDEMGIYVEPQGVVLGLEKPLPHVIERTRRVGERSQPGDTDRTLYGLRKYLGLALKGNPTVLLPLWAPDSDVLYINRHGEGLRVLRSHFLSQEAAHRFIGYCVGQRDRMMGQGRQSSVPNRPELIAKYGWDTKYGSHALRLAIQCRTLLLTGMLQLPMADADRALVLDAKTGRFAQATVLRWINEHIDVCNDLLSSGRTALPPKPSWELISELSIQTHQQFWESQRLLLP